MTTAYVDPPAPSLASLVIENSEATASHVLLWAIKPGCYGILTALSAHGS